MRTSLGQKIHLPGQGNGLVKTVKVANPDKVRIGFSRSLLIKFLSLGNLG